MFERLKTIFAPGPSARASGADRKKPDTPAPGIDGADSKKPDASAPATDKLSIKKQGDEHLRSERWAEASECYRRALAIDREYVDAMVALGYLLCEQKQHDAAAVELRHALAIDSRNADAHYLLGTIAKGANDPARAIDHFGRAIDAQPDLEFAHRELVAVAFESGQIEHTKEALRRAIAVFPRSAEFPFYLGNVLRQQGDYDDAIACYRTAAALQPDSAEVHKNLADVLVQRGQLDEASKGYQKAIALEPEFVDAHVCLGNLMHSQGDHQRAVDCHQRAVALRPQHAAGHLGLAHALQKLGRNGDAIGSYRRVVALEPNNPAAHQFLGNALVEIGATEDAVVCYEHVVRLDPASPVQHLIAALGGRSSERAPREYVEKLFDDYANKFDSHLVQVLNYSVPEKLASLLKPHAGADKWVILDLGCGTGLSAVPLAPLARELVGVDLSAKMLDKARERKLYRRLEHLDLLSMMQSEPAATYDVVFAADVFVYIGKLDELAKEARRLLRPMGLFAFSVESLEALNQGAGAGAEPLDYKLTVTGRYAHSIGYLDRMAKHNGFEVLSTDTTQSRLDKGKPVAGYLALWRCSGAGPDAR